MMKRMRRGDAQRRQYWEEVVRRWRDGGQSVRGFCRAEGVPESAFYFWRRELMRRGKRLNAENTAPPPACPTTPVSHATARILPRGPAPSFLPVQVMGPDVTETFPGVEIVLQRGGTVRVRAGFDRQALLDVLAVLEARPC